MTCFKRGLVIAIGCLAIVLAGLAAWRFESPAPNDSAQPGSNRVATKWLWTDGESDRTAADDDPSAGETQRQEAVEPPRRGRGLRGRWQRGNQFLKNHVDIKSAYRDVAAAAAQSTAEVLVGGEPVALATVIDSGGYLVSKASLLEGEELSCRFADGDEIPAVRVAVNEDYDLVLLQIDATDRSTPPWLDTAPSVGTFVAAVAPDGETISIGVISAEPRRVGGPARTIRRRAWLGVSLGDGEAGVGIADVIPESAAAKAGLAAGDRIRRIDDQDMSSMQEIIENIGSRMPGVTISVVVQRGDEELTLSATLGEPVIPTAPQDQWGGGPFSERRQGFPRVIAHDTIILPNQCGGPLIDTDGQVVGVNIARALRVATYAIPPDTLRQLVSEMLPVSAP